MEAVVDKLRGGDRRSIGRANEVVAQVINDLRLFDVVFAALDDRDPVVRMRAADVVEKVSAERPELLVGHEEALLGPLAVAPQPEVRWHVAQMLPRLDLDPADRARAVALLIGYLDDDSKIVQANAMEALTDLAELTDDDGLRQQALLLIDELVHTGSPAVRARGRRLLVRLSR